MDDCVVLAVASRGILIERIEACLCRTIQQPMKYSTHASNRTVVWLLWNALHLETCVDGFTVGRDDLCRRPMAEETNRQSIYSESNRTSLANAKNSCSIR